MLVNIHEDVFKGSGVVRNCAAYPHYALQVRYRHERVVEQELQARGYKPFVPRCKRGRKWSDRNVELEVPVFPGYIFCSFDFTKRLPILSAPGVLRVVSAGKEPLPVDPRELDAVRALLARGKNLRPCQMVPGQKVIIASGPLEGIEGVLLKIKNTDVFVVSISILQRAVSVVVEFSDIRPLYSVCNNTTT